MILELGKHAATGVDPGVTVLLTVLGIVVTAAVAVVLAVVQLRNQQRRWLLDLKWATYLRAVHMVNESANALEAKVLTKAKKAALTEVLDAVAQESILLMPQEVLFKEWAKLLSIMHTDPFVRKDFTSAYTNLVQALRKDLGVDKR